MTGPCLLLNNYEGFQFKPIFFVLFQFSNLASLVVLHLIHSLDESTETAAASTEGVITLVTLDRKILTMQYSLHIHTLPGCRTSP